MSRTTLVFSIALLVFGCARHRTGRESLPSVAWSNEQDALRTIRKRAAAAQTISARGTITFTRMEDDQSVRMDLAMVSQPPDRLRLRAWKLGRAMFDLTLTKEGAWMLAPEDRSLREKVSKAGVGAKEIARRWATFSGEFFQRSDLRIERLRDDLLLSAPQDGMTLRCYVDPRSLVPWTYLLQDNRGRVHFTLNLDDYRVVSEIPYPHYLYATSELGRIDIRFAEVELNGELAAAAFTPPRRAEKLP